MSSNLEIQKICLYCHREFTARKYGTKYCSHKCNQRHYKEVKRQQKHHLHKIITPVKQQPSTSEDFLTITKSAALIGISDRTIFRLIARGIITPIKKGRSILIAKNELLKTTVYDNIDS